MAIVHGINLSPFVRKVMVALSEKGLPYENNPVIPMSPSQEFLDISPLGKIPVYQEDDYILPDSSCIIAYLERIQPSPPLYPEDPREFARALWLEEYADTRIVDTLSAVFFQRYVRKNFMQEEPDEALVSSVINDEAPPICNYLEEQLQDREYLAGHNFSVADIAIASPFVNYAHSGERVDPVRWPALAQYLERIYARPSFKERIQEEALVTSD